MHPKSTKILSTRKSAFDREKETIQKWFRKKEVEMSFGVQGGMNQFYPMEAVYRKAFNSLSG